MKCNPICNACREAYNGVNGKRCLKLNQYVEYSQTPICNENNNTDTGPAQTAQRRDI